MFHVIVLGGISLAACGGAVHDNEPAGQGAVPDAAAAIADAGPLHVDAEAAAEAGSKGFFPSELAVYVGECDAAGTADVASDESLEGADGGDDGASSGQYEDAAADVGIHVPMEAPPR